LRRKEVGTAGWVETANQPGCYLWNSSLQRDETVTWTGGCVDGRGSGDGEMVVNYTTADGGPTSSS